jgi:hypothetical protein
MSLKNPVTPPGIDPETVRLVAQRLNHYATPGPIIILYNIIILRDHRRICDPSLTETSLCGPYLYCFIFLRNLYFMMCRTLLLQPRTATSRNEATQFWIEIEDNEWEADWSPERDSCASACRAVRQSGSANSCRSQILCVVKFAVVLEKFS